MTDPYYDLSDDFDLIYASFLSQYGVRLSQDLRGMSWREFAYLAGGLTHDTPLGQTIAIRSEKDPERLKQFTPEQKRIRNEYRRRQAKEMTKEQAADAYEQIKKAFLSLAK